MRSLATINSGGGFNSDTPARSYISRTFPLAIRGRSASVGGVTFRDASNASGELLARVERAVEPPDDLLGVTHVVRVVEDRVEGESEQAHARVGGEQLSQRRALVPGALSELLRDPIG